jgi:hypothetical protein
MTGEMCKPAKADEIRNIGYWQKVGGIDDAGVCIYPNYPKHFDMADKIKEIYKRASIEAHDVYMGPRIDIPGVGEVFITGDENFVEWNLTSRHVPGGNCTFDEDGLLEFLRELADDGE